MSEKETGLNGLTRSQLREICDQLELEYTSKSSKEELVSTIVGLKTNVEKNPAKASNGEY